MYSQIRYDYNRTGLPDFNQSNPVTMAWDRFQIEVSQIARRLLLALIIS